jgi:hypothetical protein
LFDTTKQDLKAILKQAGDGRLQLPDFQRDYVWNDEDVRSLIASIAKGFPIGALLTLQNGGPVQFKPRLLAGVPLREAEPEELLLDGQQRITSLYQSMFSPEPVRTRTPKGKEIERYYYLSIKDAIVNGVDVDDAIVGVPKDRMIRADFGRTVILDLSNREKEFELDMFPLNMSFDCHAWIYPWRDYWKERGRDVSDLDSNLYRGILELIDDYKMPIIRLDKKNSREAICLVFEKVNVGGKKLDAFELVTAIYAADRYDLREDWSGVAQKAVPGRHARIIGAPNPRDVLREISNTDFLQACTLLHTMEVRAAREAEGKQGKEVPQVSCKRQALLALPLSAYKKLADVVESGFVQAGSFLNERKIISHKDIPYQPQLIALAAVFARLGYTAQTAAAKDKLAQWFWCVVLGELYGSTTESRLARDVPELIAWLQGAPTCPRSIDEALFQEDRLLTLRSRLAAAYKGIHAILMAHGCRDFISDKPADIMTFFNDQIDIHHVFPQKWCIDKKIQPSRFNSIVNKTPLSKHSNILIGGDAPSVYLWRIQDKQGISADRLDDILRTHLINPQHLRADDFEAFFAGRVTSLSGLVAEAMDKPVVTEHGVNEPEFEPTSIVPEFDEQELDLAAS